MVMETDTLQREDLFSFLAIMFSGKRLKIYACLSGAFGGLCFR